MKRWQKEYKLALSGMILLLLIAAAAILAPLFSPYSYSAQDAGLKNLSCSMSHLFGTDKFGRDIFVRVWAGTRVSLLIGLGSAAINGVTGVIYGGLAGYLGGRVDMIMMRLADVISAIPSLLYVILITLVLGANVASILIGICVAGWVSTARIARGEIMRLKEMDYVTAASLTGVPRRVVFFRYLLPGFAGAVIVNLTFLIPQAIFTEAFLSFVGIGIEAPLASLGTLIQDARSQIQLFPSQMIYPILVLCLLVVSVSLIGADLEQAVRSRKKGV